MRFFTSIGCSQHIETGDVRRAGRGRQEAGEDAHRGGLPGAVRAEKADDLPFPTSKEILSTATLRAYRLVRPSTLIIVRLF